MIHCFKEHSTEELVAILAHEIGHYKHHHVLKGLILGYTNRVAFLGIIHLYWQSYFGTGPGCNTRIPYQLNCFWFSF